MGQQFGEGATGTNMTDPPTPTPIPEPSQVTQLGGDGEINVYVDDTGGVVCYEQQDTGELDCLPIDETRYAGG